MANVLLDFGPYNSKADSKREYDARAIGRMFDGVITDGVFPWIGDAFKITKQNGFYINVGAGRAWFNHTWNYLESPMTFKLENSDVLPRYDSVILQINSSELVRENQLLVRKGTASENPKPPEAIQNEDSQIYEYVIGYIYIPGNSSEIPDDEYDDQDQLIRRYIYNIVGLDADIFYERKYIAGYAYAVGDNHIGVKVVEIPKNDEAWIEQEDDNGVPYYVRNINIDGISNDNILSVDAYVTGNDVTNAQMQLSSVSNIYRYIIRDNVLTLYAFYKPDVGYSLRFMGKGVNNIS